MFDFRGKSIQVAQTIYWYEETHKTWWIYSKIGTGEDSLQKARKAYPSVNR